MVDQLPEVEVTASRIQPPRAAQPNQLRPLAVPQCVVEIYPYEGGKFVFQGPAILSCTVDRDIRGEVGTFAIVLPPGGPGGPSATPSWSRIITPSSLVLIGMVRGAYRTVTMVGVVRTVSEDQEWLENRPVQRNVVIVGEDFSYFFSSFSWMTLYFLGSSAGAAVAEAAPAIGLPGILSDALLSGTPDSVARHWFNEGPMAPMAGPNGLLAKTTFMYQGQPITFPDAVGSLFEPFPFIIPLGTPFIQSEGSWANKFRDILPWPFYEFFVMTAPSNWYFGPTGISGGIEFQIGNIGGTGSTPVVVGRVNPLPFIDVSATASSVTFNGINKDAWDQLPNYEPDTGFIDSHVDFSTEEVRNFFIVSPTWFRTLFGQSNSALTSFTYAFGGAADTDSIHRYGYRPEIVETSWMADTQGHFAQGGSVDVFTAVAHCTSRVFSYYEPTPLMARGRVVYNFRPDIIPGSRFTYQPFKGEEPWTFYVEGVSHSFQFGGRALTALKLTRGLPASIYADDSIGGLLTGIHMGTVQRINGVYQVNAGLKGIEAFGIGDAVASTMNVLGEIAQVYKTPQAS